MRFGGKGEDGVGEIVSKKKKEDKDTKTYWLDGWFLPSA